MRELPGCTRKQIAERGYLPSLRPLANDLDGLGHIFVAQGCSGSGCRFTRSRRIV